MSKGLLHDLLVVDLSAGIPGAYASKLFADAGATVVKVEPPTGDPLRAPENGREGESALFRYLHRGKRSTVGAPEDRHVQVLMAKAHLVVESYVPQVLDLEELRRQYPSLVILSLTPYGRTGPWEERPATEFTVQAESGALACRSRKDREPLQIGGRLGEWLAGLYGATGALAAVESALRGGGGRLVDASVLTALNYSAAAQACAKFETQRVPPLDEPYRFLEAPSIEPTLDGYVGFNTNTRQQFEDFLVLIERTDLLAHDERWASASFRAEHVDEWNEFVHPWTTKHTTADIVALATLLRIPVAPVGNGKTVLEHPQFVARAFFRTVPGDTFSEPRAPYKVDGARPETSDDSPALGEYVGSSDEWPSQSKPEATPDGLLPLAGLRVIDATAWWAGPVVGQIFAALGAEVIHLESIQRPDQMRFAVGPLSTSPSWWEKGYLFLGTNNNKMGVTIDLNRPVGRDLVRRLIVDSDVMVENASPRVFESFDLDQETVLGLNPQMVYVRMPAFGLDGPWRDSVGFAQTMEQVTGLAWVTGPPGQPTIPRGPCDPAAGFHAAFAALSALHRRDRENVGAFIEATMCEAVLAVAAEPVIEWSAYGHLQAGLGNRSQRATQGLYACSGRDEWLALSIETDNQWVELVKLLGSPRWATSDLFDHQAGRLEGHDEIDLEISRWASSRSLNPTVELLASRGIPAGRVVDPRLASLHPQFKALGYFETVHHDVAGQVTIAPLPFSYRGVTSWIQSPAPVLGQHNREVLCGILGLDEDSFQNLLDDDVIGTRPLFIGADS